MSKSNEQGLQTFDQALYKLFKSGEITYEDALHHADSANDLRLMIKLDQSDDESLSLTAEGFNLEDTEMM